MEDKDVIYVEIWVGLAQVRAEKSGALMLKRGAKYAHVWCATHAENQADFEQRAQQTLASQGLLIATFEQVCLAEEMSVIPDELFSLLGKVQQEEQVDSQHQDVFFSPLLYLPTNQRLI